YATTHTLHYLPTRRSSDLTWKQIASGQLDDTVIDVQARRVKEYGERTGKKVFLSFDLEMDTRTPANGTPAEYGCPSPGRRRGRRSEEHTSELQSRENLVCR